MQSTCKKSARVQSGVTILTTQAHAICKDKRSDGVVQQLGQYHKIIHMNIKPGGSQPTCVTRNASWYLRQGNSCSNNMFHKNGYPAIFLVYFLQRFPETCAPDQFNLISFQKPDNIVRSKADSGATNSAQSKNVRRKFPDPRGDHCYFYAYTIQITS